MERTSFTYRSVADCWSLALIIGLLLAIGPLFAPIAAVAENHPDVQKPGDPPERFKGMPFQTFLASGDYMTALREHALNYERKYGPCATPEFAGRLNVGRASFATTISDHGVPPQWLEVVKITGCDDPFPRNILVMIVEGELRYFPLLLGKSISRTDAILQRDVVRSVILSERAVAQRSGCSKSDKVRLLSAVLLHQKKSGASTIWEEGWALQNCHGRKLLKIHFKTSPEGGTDFVIEQHPKN
ncbi:hypothetical protein MnTg02_00773 [bacterium MnTg02]|nr:hypothetical protein MnTg02_00773 [bacterium MnTg02]